jgi:hypothetical protein
MDFLANKFMRRMVYFIIGLLSVALFSFGSSQWFTATAADFSSNQQHQSQELSSWRNPSHQEANFYP